jgi:uncharacterized protein (UPF0210 family)
VVTAALKETTLQTCGYCGLMLPVLEDYGLAERNNQGLIRLSSLLAYSAVCGTGLDTIPLPGDVSENQLSALLFDVATLYGGGVKLHFVYRRREPLPPSPEIRKILHLNQLRYSADAFAA